ncbi:hypothetical protein BJ508DRAFT_411242 [Ascobolus immersus RN42]|uniref:Uncharacterized protein n=1 Tax=Ascobolus immersus RN42 TaxID=1160509 RepID=A0A3N4IPA1_ASCIM|nr:hypothetical protein BJ508DRAFT_411242 [Ascobolus immersus RN42]
MPDEIKTGTHQAYSEHEAWPLFTFDDLKDIVQHSFLSDAAQNILIEHFANVPKSFLLPDDSEEDYFYACVCQILPDSEAQDDYAFHPRFHPIVERYLMLYAQLIYPFFESIGHTRCNAHLESDPRSEYLGVILALGDNDDASRLGLAIASRWKSGLLKEEQVWLLEIVTLKLLVDVQAIMASSTMDTQYKLTAFGRASYRTGHLIRQFLGSYRFRSARLELLLLEYIAEDGLNMELVDGILAKELPHWRESWADFPNGRRQRQ